MRTAVRPSRPSARAYIGLGALTLAAVEAVALKLVQVGLGLDFGRHVNMASLAGVIILAVASCAVGWRLADRCRRVDLDAKVVEITELRQRAREVEDRVWWGSSEGEDLERTVDLERVPDNVRVMHPGRGRAKGTAG